MSIPITKFIFVIVTITSWISGANPPVAHTSTIVSNTFSYQFGSTSVCRMQVRSHWVMKWCHRHNFHNLNTSVCKEISPVTLSQIWFYIFAIKNTRFSHTAVNLGQHMIKSARSLVRTTHWNFYVPTRVQISTKMAAIFHKFLGTQQKLNTINIFTGFLVILDPTP
jgi:hypothetical protein